MPAWNIGNRVEKEGFPALSLTFPLMGLWLSRLFIDTTPPGQLLSDYSVARHLGRSCLPIGLIARGVSLAAPLPLPLGLAAIGLGLLLVPGKLLLRNGLSHGFILSLYLDKGFQFFFITLGKFDPDIKSPGQ